MPQLNRQQNSDRDETNQGIVLGFLRERLGVLQKFSVLFAFAGVLYLVVGYGRIPWIALILALSFGFYGLLRKVAKIDALIGLTIEALLLAPIAAIYLVYLSNSGQTTFLSGLPSYNYLLPLSGVLTAIPLLFFIATARRLPIGNPRFFTVHHPLFTFCFSCYCFCRTIFRIPIHQFLIDLGRVGGLFS